MRVNSTVEQCLQAMQTVNSIGQSKHDAKNIYLAETGKQPIDKFMAGFAKSAGVYGIQTFKDYLSVSITFAKYVKETYGIKDISRINAEHAAKWLESKVKEKVSKSTIQKYVSALEKFEVALSRKYGKEFNLDVKSVSGTKLSVHERSGYHPYDRPAELVNRIQKMDIRNEYKLASRLQLETGIRGQKDMNGVMLANSGIQTKTKAGKKLKLNISEALYRDLRTHLQTAGKNKLSVNYGGYLRVLRQASSATNQKYEASHGLRHSYAVNTARKLQESGMSFKDAWRAVSVHLGHNRTVYNYMRG